MSVLVTGAGGMIGSHMVETLVAKGEDVIGTYYKPTVDVSELDRSIRMIECDVRYPESIERILCDNLPTEIYHLAAQSYPTVSWQRPYETIDVNINGTIAVFEAIKKARRLICGEYDPMVVVACSSAEYGEALNRLKGDTIYVRESTELLPLHPYGVSKVGQDLLSFQYYQNDQIRCIRARIFNTTGTRKVNDVTSDFTYRAVEAERNGTYELRVGNLNTKRAILDQRDLISALLLLAKKGKPGDVYNISSEHVYPIQAIIELIEREIGHSLETRPDPQLFRSTDERVIAGDVTKLKRDTGWKQEVTLEQTIHDMILYWKNLKNRNT